MIENNLNYCNRSPFAEIKWLLNALLSPLRGCFLCKGILRTAVNLKEEGNISGVRSKPLLINDLRNMVAPSINDAIWLLEKEIAFPYPGLARKAT